MNLAHFVENPPESIMHSMIHRKHGKGSAILYPGEENNYLYLLIKGAANVIIQNLSGNGFTLYSYHAYSCFGELELFHESGPSFHVVSQTDCETIAIPKEKVFEWMKGDFDFTRFLIAQLTEKLLVSSQKLAAISLLGVTDRLLYCIYTHYQLGDLETLTKQDVCAETFIPLRSLNRAIAECSKHQYFSFHSKQFRILSNTKMEAYCSSLV